ncbi:unnamed protein product [Prorocentrum cordatum]|uniref:F-box domain-containing protein n=1 Tax=Prorocentrum cordatum TaxID=2364126 RepID=A0ABN9TJQ2_9DINO|nr:unnamed protein product [Polarella glacialis]
MASPAFSAVPDEVLARVMWAHPRRCEVRALARRWRSVAGSRFALRRLAAPRSLRFCVDFEVDRCMSKDTYTAAFEAGGPEQALGGIEGTVAFLNWAPVYYRSAIGERRDVRHRLLQADACALWRLIAGLLAGPRGDLPPSGPPAGPGWGPPPEF